ncbi:MAG: HNH endonuclease [Duncaniella sp.]|nr:HNH endonuclease [Duncaniella sp.]
MAKDNDYKRLIHTSRWQRLRREVLGSHPLCKRCEDDGFISAATEVHHIVPVEEGLSVGDKERLMFNPSNLMPLCHRCHVEVHTEMGRCGKDANLRRMTKKLGDFQKKFLG